MCVRQSYLGLWVDVGPMVEKDFCNTDLVFLSCQVQWCKSTLYAHMSEHTDTFVMPAAQIEPQSCCLS